ncbi:MAG: hypothetical protein JNK45_36520, partial [Myxococcales bacterium]|nr:hypothetical protein [Myxococcales bacterium]
MRRRGSALLGCLLGCLAGACGERAPSEDATPVAAATPTVAAATTVSATPPDPRTAPRPLADVVALVPEGATAWIAIRDPFALI